MLCLNGALFVRQLSILDKAPFANAMGAFLWLEFGDIEFCQGYNVYANFTTHRIVDVFIAYVLF